METPTRVWTFREPNEGIPTKIFLDLDQVAAAYWNADFDRLTVVLKSGHAIPLGMDEGNAIAEALARLFAFEDHPW